MTPPGPNPASDANAAAISIDLQAGKAGGTAAQGIFLKSTTGGSSGKIMNYVDSTGVTIFALLADGSLLLRPLAVPPDGTNRFAGSFVLANDIAFTSPALSYRCPRVSPNQAHSTVADQRSAARFVSRRGTRMPVPQRRETTAQSQRAGRIVRPPSSRRFVGSSRASVIVVSHLALSI